MGEAPEMGAEVGAGAEAEAELGSGGGAPGAGVGGPAEEEEEEGGRAREVTWMVSTAWLRLERSFWLVPLVTRAWPPICVKRAGEGR